MALPELAASCAWCRRIATSTRISLHTYVKFPSRNIHSIHLANARRTWSLAHLPFVALMSCCMPASLRSQFTFFIRNSAGITTCKFIVGHFSFVPSLNVLVFLALLSDSSLLPARAGPSRAVPSRAGPGRAEPSRAESIWGGPGRTGPSRSGPGPNRAQPSRAHANMLSPPGPPKHSKTGPAQTRNNQKCAQHAKTAPKRV